MWKCGIMSEFHKTGQCCFGLSFLVSRVVEVVTISFSVGQEGRYFLLCLQACNFLPLQDQYQEQLHQESRNYQ